MQTLQDDQAAQWCEAHGVRVDGSRPSTRVSPIGAEARRFRVTVKGKATDAVGLAYVVLMAGTDDVDVEFSGGLLWLSRWELWSAEIDRAGYVLLGGITSQRQQAPDGGLAPGYVFAGGEFVDAHAAVSVPLLFEWDAHFVPVGGGFVVFMSHDGYVDVLSQDESVHDRLYKRFQQAGWSPVEARATAG